MTLQRLDQLQLGAVHVGEYNVIVVGDELASGGVHGCILSIGDRTYVGSQNNIRAAGGSIHIGKRCLISQQVVLVASNHGLVWRRPVLDSPWDRVRVGIVIEDDVWLGAQVVVLPGVRIGEGAVVAAGSVVTRDVAAFSIVAGAPARVIRLRDPEPASAGSDRSAGDRR